MDRIRNVSPRIQVKVATDEKERLAAAKDAHVILGRLDEKIFRAAENLRWIQKVTAGVDGLLFPDFVESDVMLTSAKGLMGKPLAEHTWALILALSRGIAWSVRNPGYDNREPVKNYVWEMEGKTLGVIGLGGTGFEVAKRGRAFGVRTLAIDPRDMERPDFVHRLWKPVRFLDLLEKSDIVSICCPLTPETDGLFDHQAFRTMKDSSLLINVTRGAIVEYQSLIRALEEGLIAGAGLDVPPKDPLPSESPLWGMENVVITSHIGGGSHRRMDRLIDRFTRNLDRFMKGKPLEGVINKEKGY